MYRTETDLSKACRQRAERTLSMKRQRLVWLGLILPFLIGGSEIQADSKVDDIRSFEQALKANSTILPRFYLHDGQLIIGRFLGLKAGTITVRRPSGGLRSIAVDDIETIQIVDDDGNRRRGRLTALADGTVRWEVPDRSLAVTPELASRVRKEQPAETGGPLIKLPPDETDPEETDDAQADDAAVVVAEPAKAPVQDIAIDTDRPATTIPAVENKGTPAPVHLSVRADQAGEAEKTMIFRLKLSEPPERSVVIIYTVLKGSATETADYMHRQGIVVFEPGQQEATLAIEIVDDDVVEDVETFKLFVTGDPKTVTIANRTIEAFIEDDDG